VNNRLESAPLCNPDSEKPPFSRQQILETPYCLNDSVTNYAELQIPRTDKMDAHQALGVAQNALVKSVLEQEGPGGPSLGHATGVSC